MCQSLGQNSKQKYLVFRHNRFSLITQCSISRWVVSTPKSSSICSAVSIQRVKIAQSDSDSLGFTVALFKLTLFYRARIIRGATYFEDAGQRWRPCRLGIAPTPCPPPPPRLMVLLRWLVWSESNNGLATVQCSRQHVLSTDKSTDTGL